MSRVTHANSAEADLREIWDYVSERNLLAADALLERFLEVSETLASQPLGGRARPELGPAMRSFPVGDYMMFYEPVSDGIEVVRILHSHRDIDSDLF
jgi:toxin ParE1/3/4